MKAETIKRLTIEVEGKDIDNLKSGLKKITKEIKRPGYKNTDLTSEEIEVIENLSKEIK